VWCIFVQLQRSGFHHCRDPPLKKHLIGFFCSPFSSSFFARFLRAYVIRGPILQDQDWTVHSSDENLATIANTRKIHQTLVFTSDRHLSVAQRFCLFTSIVNVGCGLVPGSIPTALPPLRKQCLRHEVRVIDSTPFRHAPLHLVHLCGSNPSPIYTESLHLCGRIPAESLHLRTESLHLCGYIPAESLHLCGPTLFEAYLRTPAPCGRILASSAPLRPLQSTVLPSFFGSLLLSFEFNHVHNDT
jgi:hypothetical protein